MGPVLLSLDAELQENPIGDRPRLRIPKLAHVVPPVGDPGAIAEAARLLTAAQAPVIVVDRLARTPAGMAHLVELAEALQCAVIDEAGRMNFPSRHPLNQTFRRAAVLGEADVILAIEMNDLWSALNSFRDRIERSSQPIFKPGTKIVTLGSRDLYLKANYQDFGRYNEVDLAIAGDGEASLPLLTERIRQRVDPGRRSDFEARGRKLAQANRASLEQVKSLATIGWDASPITTARLCAETVGPDQGQGLVAGGQRHPDDLAAPFMGLRQAISVERRLRRLRPGLQRAGLGGRCARQSSARPLDRLDPGRRRSDVRAGHAVDLRAPPHPDPVRDAQQTAPITRSSCACRRWQRATPGASRMPTSARP